MKLILSRKGFDTSAGGVPSPIFPDDRIVSLPIPDKLSPITYQELSYSGGSLGDLVAQLTKDRIPAHFYAHVDPDLVYESLPRAPGWHAIFGQTGAAQSHLRNNAVGPGDLFLFFGLFRRIEMLNGIYTWVRNAKPVHVIWGWLQVMESLQPDNLTSDDYAWAKYHTHFNRADDPNNTVYIARKHLQIDGLVDLLPGAGAFPHFSPSRQLTVPNTDRITNWELPGWFNPDGKQKPLTYHTDLMRWQKREEGALLRAAARGQEFVLDCDEYPEAPQWACGMIQGYNS